jgi:hypothetical protein
MAWESRGGRGRYYTRTRKVKGGWVREYHGCGPEAHAAAAAVALRRAERQRQAAARRAERVRLGEADRLLMRLFEMTGLVASAALAVGGFHSHRGEWRCRRHGRDSGTQA